MRWFWKVLRNGFAGCPFSRGHDGVHEIVEQVFMAIHEKRGARKRFGLKDVQIYYLVPQISAYPYQNKSYVDMAKPLQRIF
jgi:hypothetical protein